MTNKQRQLIEYVILDIIGYQIGDDGIEVEEAMTRFYASEVFERLQDTESGLYLESSPFVYGLFRDELRYGHIIQLEQ
jgi:hypothetical protein